MRYVFLLLCVACQSAPTSSLPQQPAEPAAKPSRVVVVGGGLAGLVTAYELQKRGISAHVLEATNILGGRAFTADYGNGLTAEAGLQEFWEGNPLLSIAKELSVPLDGEPKETYSSVLLGGKVYPYIQPTVEAYLQSVFSASELAALQRFLEKAKKLHALAHTEGIKNPQVKDLQDYSFASWLTVVEKLPPKVAEWIKLTLDCELGTEWENFSALFGLLEFEIFLKGTVPNFHVKGGNSRLVEALARAIQGPKTLSALVTGVSRQTDQQGKISVQVDYIQNNKVASLKAERVVLAVPFVRLHQISMEPPLPEEAWQAIYTLSLGQYTVVHFHLDKQARKLWELGDSASPFPILSDGPLGVIYGVNEKAPEVSPVEIFTLLIYGRPARAFHMVAREAKIQELHQELDKLWPGISGFIRETHIYTYHPASLPVWPAGRSPLDAGAKLLRQGHRGLFLAGDYTVNAHSDGAAKSGIRVAEQIAKELQ